MHIGESARLAAMTLLTNAFGESVGMEAAYTQAGSGIFSAVGQALNLRRRDLRIFVAAGAAAAIAAIFNAPLAGAFYGFELVLGTYSIAALFQVGAAALAGALTGRVLVSSSPLFTIPAGNIAVPGWDYPIFILLGVAAGLVGIRTMKMVTWCEKLFRGAPIAPWLRPAAGGAVIGLLALACPEILGSGQGAINRHLQEQQGLIFLCVVLAAKIAGSAVTIGSGFRGGMFSSALFLGCLLGQIMGVLAAHLLPDAAGQMTLFTLVGMAAVAASIVGAPVTMVMLILETTGDFAATTGVLAGVMAAAAVTRHFFGYSFSTWRFHLRGLPIHGAQDVGWIAELTVDGLMSRDMRVVAPDTKLSALPPGNGRVYVVDGDGFYRGWLDPARLPPAPGEETTAGDAAAPPDQFLIAGQDIRAALDRFAAWEAEELPVIWSASEPKILGTLREAPTLRRYAQELEYHHRAANGGVSPPAFGAVGGKAMP
jgi:CIC family chloride channel protein